MIVPLFSNLTHVQAEDFGLVLSSAGIFFQIEKDIAGWQIWVYDHDAERAMSHVRRYRIENPGTPAPAPAPVLSGLKIADAIWVSLLLLAVYIAVGDDQELFSNIYGASAGDILDGEIYRAVTALFLHADSVHLAGNMAALTFFAAVACSINGNGAGWFLILLSGFSGNLANAFLHQSGHSAIGASTAVFGAVGMVAAYQFHQKIILPEERLKAWLPLAGGLALLTLLGTGEGRTDLMAHLFGFFSGLIFQGLFGIWVKGVLPEKMQWIFLAMTVLVTALCFLYPVLITRNGAG